MHIFFVVFAAGALAIALLSSSVWMRAGSWVAFATCWYMGIVVSTTSSTAGPGVLYALVAMVPVAFLLMSWRASRVAAAGRPRNFDLWVAEAEVLALGLIVLYFTVFDSAMDQEPTAHPALTWQFATVFIVAATAFAAAAVMRADRRIAYPAAALTCALIVVFYKPILYTQDVHYPGVDFLSTDALFALIFLGIPALGAAGQLAWWLLHRRRPRRDYSETHLPPFQ